MVVWARNVIVPPVNCCISGVTGVNVLVANTVMALRPGTRRGGLRPVLAAGLMISVPAAQLTLTHGRPSRFPAMQPTETSYS